MTEMRNTIKTRNMAEEKSTKRLNRRPPRRKRLRKNDTQKKMRTERQRKIHGLEESHHTNMRTRKTSSGERRETARRKDGEESKSKKKKVFMCFKCFHHLSLTFWLNINVSPSFPLVHCGCLHSIALLYSHPFSYKLGIKLLSKSRYSL